MRWRRAWFKRRWKPPKVPLDEPWWSDKAPDVSRSTPYAEWYEAMIQPSVTGS